MTGSNGTALEALVRHSAARQRLQELWLVQTGPRFVGRVVGPHREAIGRLVSLGELDFIGDLRGRLVTFDCKSTAIRTSLKLELLKPHQVAIVEQAHKRGGIAFFLVEFREPPEPRYYALQWSVLEPYWLSYVDGKGRASIPRGVIARECVEIRRTRRTLDLVGCIEALMGQEVA